MYADEKMLSSTQQLIEELITEITAPNNYLDLGHDGSDGVELWVYIGGQILIKKDTDNYGYQGVFGTTDQAFGRIDFFSGQGSISFGTNNERSQRIIIRKLRERFPLIEFWVFPDEEGRGVPLHVYEKSFYQH